MVLFNSYVKLPCRVFRQFWDDHRSGDRDWSSKLGFFGDKTRCKDTRPGKHTKSYWKWWFSSWIYPLIAWWFSIVFCKRSPEGKVRERIHQIWKIQTRRKDICPKPFRVLLIVADYFFWLCLIMWDTPISGRYNGKEAMKKACWVLGRFPTQRVQYSLIVDIRYNCITVYICIYIYIHIFHDM